MQFSGRTWRPPHERWTPIIEATSGCAWGRCAFCDLFCEERFSISPLDRFCAELDEIKASVPYARRLWLTGGDPFQMGFSRLEERALSVRDRLIKMQTIAMFASVRDIPRYTDAQLARLASLRIGGLVVGMESADDETLSLANKGYTSGEVKSQLIRLERAGISYNVIYMTGLAEKGRGRVAARNTLDVLNGLRPDIVGITSLTLMPKTPLAVLGESGGLSADAGEGAARRTRRARRGDRLQDVLGRALGIEPGARCRRAPVRPRAHPDRNTACAGYKRRGSACPGKDEDPHALDIKRRTVRARVRVQKKPPRRSARRSIRRPRAQNGA